MKIKQQKAILNRAMNELLIEATQKNDLESIKRYSLIKEDLNKGYPHNESLIRQMQIPIDTRNNKPLHVAAICGYSDALRSCFAKRFE